MVNLLIEKVWTRVWRASLDLARRCTYYQERNAVSYKSRKRRAEVTDTS